MAPVGVTGASGFIGSAVVRQLLEQGREVRALLEPGANTANLDDLPGAKLDRVVVEVSDGTAMRRALSGCASLYHLAAIYKLWVPDPERIYRTNVEGTTATLLAAQAAGVGRVVFTSSIAAVGMRADGAPADESVAFNLWDIANDYILTKHLSERIALQFAASGLPVVVVNPGFPFGPRDRAPTPTGQLILSMLRGEVPGYMPGGFSAIDVDDCAAGHLLAEERGVVGERYLLVNHNASFRDFQTMVAEAAGLKPPRVRLPNLLSSAAALGGELVARHLTHREPQATYRSVRYAQRKVYFDNTRAKDQLGLPSRPLRQSIDRAIEFFRTSAMA